MGGDTDRHDPERTANLLGALAVGLRDATESAVAEAVERRGAAAAALTALAYFPGQTIERLSASLGLSHSATVRLVDRLVRNGLAERRPGARAPAVAVHLTPGGVARARAMADARQESLRAVLAALDAGERQTLTSISEKLLGALTVDPHSGDRICRLCDIAVCPQDRCPVAKVQTALGAPPAAAALAWR